ncbi:glycosyltransferase family 4 protein [Sphingobium phenoxybenzoativorans]|uniref:Glycosyltransferase family 4 protein n=1 Tax=Sphingobium phenoxybenzoativorans TaxID=1592790 RepID=A0A975Q1Q4_9SPHN|nr:glycosyltransferase family 4 protein [Sphingobium phenoxybenzoativorans]QUT05667.1 glycosyltransferase family 4 protein [Sphingobium phenoxybenzoativorans]
MSASTPAASIDRLILVTAAYFPDSYGGAERQAKILAEALGRLGVHVTIAAPTISPDAPLFEETEFGAVRRVRVAHYPNYGGLRMPSTLRWTRRLLKMFKREEWAGVPVYVFHARLHALAAALLSRQLRSPLVLKLGGGGESSDFHALDEKRYFYGKIIKRYLLNQVDIFVSNGKQITQDLKGLGVASERIVEFFNGAILPNYHDVHSANMQKIGNKFIFTGRIIKDKNIDLLFSAASEVARHREVRFVIVGDGEEMGRLVHEAAHLGLSKSFDFTGFQSNVTERLLGCDFFISASTREGQSNSLLEAMSCGCIPVVAAASGVDDVVEDGKSGFIVKDVSAAAFIETINRVLDLSAEDRGKLSEASRSYAENNFGIEAIASRTISAISAATTAQ